MEAPISRRPSISRAVVPERLGDYLREEHSRCEDSNKKSTAQLDKEFEEAIRDLNKASIAEKRGDVLRLLEPYGHGLSRQGSRSIPDVDSETLEPASPRSPRKVQGMSSLKKAFSARDGQDYKQFCQVAGKLIEECKYADSLDEECKYADSLDKEMEATNQDLEIVPSKKNDDTQDANLLPDEHVISHLRDRLLALATGVRDPVPTAC